MTRSALLPLVLGWLLLGVGCSDAPKGPVAADGGRTVACPECRKEFPYMAEWIDKPCPACSKPNIKLVETIRGEAPTPTWHKWVAMGVFIAVIGQAGILFWLQRKRFVGKKEKQAPPELKCRCPYCRRKYRYLASRAGQGVICRNCKTAFVFPGEDDADPETST